MSEFSRTDLLNVTHISSNLEKYEAARSNFFVFEVMNTPTDYLPDGQLTNLVRPHVSSDTPAATDYFDGDVVEDFLKLNVMKASVPSFTVESKPYRRGNDVVKFAGVPTFNDGSITVDDVVGVHVKDMLYAWLYLAYNPHTRKGGRMIAYKKTAYLSEYTQDYEFIRRWKLEGCFVTGIDEAEFDRENGDDKRQLTVAISYDRAILDEVDYDRQ